MQCEVAERIHLGDLACKLGRQEGRASGDDLYQGSRKEGGMADIKATAVLAKGPRETSIG